MELFPCSFCDILINKSSPYLYFGITFGTDVHNMKYTLTTSPISFYLRVPRQLISWLNLPHANMKNGIQPHTESLYQGGFMQHQHPRSIILSDIENQTEMVRRNSVLCSLQGVISITLRSSCWIQNYSVLVLSASIKIEKSTAFSFYSIA